jgi:hypothetical protein
MGSTSTNAELTMKEREFIGDSSRNSASRIIKNQSVVAIRTYSLILSQLKLHLEIGPTSDVVDFLVVHAARSIWATSDLVKV